MGKKKLGLFILILVSVISLTGIFVFAYFNYFYKMKGSEISIENVKFTVNDSPNKAEENLVYISSDELSKRDGYQITLNYSLNGTFVSNYAMKYFTYFQITSDVSGVASAIDLYQFKDGAFRYRGNLHNLAKNVNAEITEDDAIYVDYLGANGIHKEKFLLVYPMGSEIEGNANLGIKISTTSQVKQIDNASDFPYYYLNDIGGASEEEQSTGETAEMILKKGPNNEAIYGRNIVLMKDIKLKDAANTIDILFKNNVGLDLNGHTLDLNGNTITFGDASETGDVYNPICKLTDSVGTGKIVNSKIKINLSKTILDIEDEFYKNEDGTSKLDANSSITVSSISVDAYKNAINDKMIALSKNKHLTDNGTFTFNALGNLKYYVDNNIITVSPSIVCANSVNAAIVKNQDQTFTISNISRTDMADVILSFNYNTSIRNVSASIDLFGTNAYDCAEYLKSYIPTFLNGSIYLPTYIASFDAYVTWISSDEDLLSSTGLHLPNGYRQFDNWYGKTIKLGFVIDQSGKILNGVCDNIYVEILLEEERADLLFSTTSVNFDDTDNHNSYSFSFIDLLAEKYQAYQNDGTIDLTVIADEFNVTSYTDADDLLSRIITKLGLASVPYTVIASQESAYIREITDPDIMISSIEQNGVPSEILLLVYNVNFSFINEGASSVVVPREKIFTISSADEAVSFVDLTNTLRVPFDVYSNYMNEYEVVNGENIYNQYLNSFELISSFGNSVINYTIPQKYQDYVSIVTYPNGSKILEVKKDNVPADTHTVTIEATVGDSTDKIYLPFTCVGVLHNISSKKHAEFDDGNLYIELLNKYDSNGDTVLTDLEAKNSNITSFTMTSRNVKSLKGLRYFEKLTTINFSSNKISDIDDLAYLKNLTTVNLASNLISSLEPLAYAETITNLNVSYNQISSIEEIQYLKNLIKLNVGANNISDFSYVQYLTKLTELKVFSNTISNLPTVEIPSNALNYATVDTIRANLYYFNLLKELDPSLNLYIRDANTSYSFYTNSKDIEEAFILSLIEPITKTASTLVLPTVVTADFDGNGTTETYHITYFTSSYDKYIKITHTNYETTDIELVNLPIDNKVIIYAHTVAGELAGADFYRPLVFTIRGDVRDTPHYGEIEVATDHWMKAEDVVKDQSLLTALWVAYDLDSDGKITNAELNPSTGVELELDSSRISNLSGIQYFKNITSLNLRGNLLDDENGDGFADIKLLSYLTSLKKLYLSGQLFNFDELLYYTRLHDGSGNYQKTETGIDFNLKDVDGDDFTVTFNRGLTTLETLYANGSLGLNDYSVKTALYHVFLNNTALGTSDTKVIYKDSASASWNPITEETNKFLGSLTTTANFLNYNDEIQIKKEYSFYMYDDLYPTTFTLTNSSTISDSEYVFSGGSNGKVPSDNAYKNVYYNGVNTQLSGVDSSFISRTNHQLKEYFNIDTASSDDDIIITYKKLIYKDYQAYLNMSIAAKNNQICQGRRTYNKSNTSYYLTLFMQYNNNYTFLNDSATLIDTSDDGKPLNSVFGAVETMLFVMNGLTKELSTGLRENNYTITKDDGTIEKHDSANANYVVTTTEVSAYDGSYGDGKGSTYSSDNYFFIHGNFMPTAKSAVDGLRFLSQINKLYFRRDAVLGTGKDLINITELFVDYTYLDLQDFDTILPNLRILISAQGTATNLSDETSLTSNPNDLIETYLVYLPNLMEFYFNGDDEGNAGKGVMYEWSAFLAYSYIPYSQVINPRYARTVNNETYVAGMILDTDGKYYWYDETDVDFDNFKHAYYLNGSTYEVLTHAVLEANINSIFATNGVNYTNIFADSTGTALSSEHQLFRHVKSGSVDLTNFKLSGTGNTYSNTYENQMVLMEVYRNLQPDTSTYYYLKADPQNGNTPDFDPTFSPIEYDPTVFGVVGEYDELAPAIADLHVQLTGSTFDGTELDDTEYSSLSWRTTDYSDYFRKGLVVKLPTKFEDYKTGIEKYDKYRNFTIRWYVSYQIQDSVRDYQYTQIEVGSTSGLGSSSKLTTYFSASFNSDVITLTLNYSGYYLFEGLLELVNTDDSTEKYSYYTSYDLSKRGTTIDVPYTYDNEITGSVSIIYPISITSLSNADISANNNISSNIDSIFKISKKIYTIDYENKTVTNTYNLKWFDTIVDRTFKYLVFLAFGNETDSNKGNFKLVTFNLGYNVDITKADNNPYKLYDKILKAILGVDVSKNNKFTSNNLSTGINAKSKIKTYAGLHRLISEVFTFDGWETLADLETFNYRYAELVSYLPERYPVKLKTLRVLSMLGFTYYGGLFDSNVEEASIRGYSTSEKNNEGTDASTNSKRDTFETDGKMNLNDYFTQADLATKKIKLKNLDINAITDDSLALLSQLSNSSALSNKLTIVLHAGSTSAFTLDFAETYEAAGMTYAEYYKINANTSMVGFYVTTSNSDKATTIDIYVILQDLFTIYGKVLPITESTTPDHMSENELCLYDNGSTLETISGDKTVTMNGRTYQITPPVQSVYGDGSQTPYGSASSDFFPLIGQGKNVSFYVGIRYVHKADIYVKIYKYISEKSSNNPTDQYTIIPAVFTSGVKTGTNISYSINDLTILSLSYFDKAWIRSVLTRFNTPQTGKTSSSRADVTVNNNATTIPVLIGYQKWNSSTKTAHTEGYTIILDKNLGGSDTWYLIFNTEVFDYRYKMASSTLTTSFRSHQYAVIDMKGWEKLPFKAFLFGHGHDYTHAMITKVVNTDSNPVNNPKLEYIGLNLLDNGEYKTSPKVNYSLFTNIEDISGVEKSMVDGGMVYFGDRIKLAQKLIKYDPDDGFLYNYTGSKIIHLEFLYSRMHYMFFNGNYDTSLNYMYFKNEIYKSIEDDDPLIFVDKYDEFITRKTELVNMGQGTLSNITMNAQILNHPFNNASGILANDSAYSYMIHRTSPSGVLYSSTKYDKSKMIASLINVHSDNIRELSNGRYLSMLVDETSATTQLDTKNVYVLNANTTIKLSKIYNGDSVVYIPISLVYIYDNNTSNKYKLGPYYDPIYNYAFNAPNDFFTFCEYQGYWEIKLTQDAPKYTALRFEFAVFENTKNYSSDALYTTKQLYDKYYILNNDLDEHFYVDINYTISNGNQVVKPDDPVYVPRYLTILGTRYELAYETNDSNVVISYAEGSSEQYYQIALAENAITKNNVKITCGRVSDITIVTTYDRLKQRLYDDGVTTKVDQNFDNGRTNKLIAATEDPYTLTVDYKFYKLVGGSYVAIARNQLTKDLINDGLIYVEGNGIEYKTLSDKFNFYVDTSTGAKLAESDNYSILSNDFYVELLVNSTTGEHVPGSLIYDDNSNYITSSETDEVYIQDSNGTPISGYEWRTVKADTVFESGLLLTDLYYSGAIAIGKSDYNQHYTRDESNSASNNIAFFPKYVVMDSDGEFVLDNGSKILYDNSSTGYQNAKDYIDNNSALKYHLALIYTKEQIADIHYFSCTSYHDNKVDFRAQSVLTGIEIFPLTYVRLGFRTNNNYLTNQNNRAFPGNTFTPLKHMKLIEFFLVNKHTSIFVSDWTFLFNSRDTLTKFYYGGAYHANHQETYATTHDDFSFLLSFDNLTEIYLFGLPGIDETQSFKFFLIQMYLKHSSNIVHYYRNTSENGTIFTGISSDVNTAATVLSLFDSRSSIATDSLDIDSDFTYRNGYELFLGTEGYYSSVANYDDTDSTTEYLLPSFINDSGTYYKLTYDSLSNFANIVVKDGEGNELTMLQYQALYAEYVEDCLENAIDINDYEFVKDYRIYIRFNNLDDCLTDRIMISVKIESQSKMISKDLILDSDNAKTDNQNLVTTYKTDYYDNMTYVYTPYQYARYLSIYVNHLNY